MNDLISRQALKQTLGINADDCDNCAWGYHGRCKRGNDFEDACCAIDDAPSAEPDVIKCKDCVHWIPFAINPHYCILHDWVSGADDYCSRAERRTDEQSD